MKSKHTENFDHRDPLSLLFDVRDNVRRVYCFEDDGLGFITQLNYSSLLELIFPDFIECVSRVIEKRETSTSEGRARDARANRETGF